MSSKEQTEEPKKKGILQKKYVRWSLVAILSLLLLVAAYVAFAYFSTPATIRKPQLEHYHFRMQILVDGKAEDFGSQAYQTGYAKDQCNANLPEQPIHFHDGKDQFVHIHWEGMTGGMVMKYYGWNYIGGLPNALGYKVDVLGDIQKVTTHGNYLPNIPAGSSFYIYTGNADTYTKKSFDDWRDKDLEEFFGKTSNSPAHEINKQKSGLLDKLMPRAYAHGDEVDGHVETTKTEEELTEINNLIGNIVIFVQKDAPTDAQIKDRFNDLEPLGESTCGG